MSYNEDKFRQLLLNMLLDQNEELMEIRKALMIIAKRISTIMTPEPLKSQNEFYSDNR